MKKMIPSAAQNQAGPCTVISMDDYLNARSQELAAAIAAQYPGMDASELAIVDAALEADERFEDWLDGLEVWLNGTRLFHAGANDNKAAIQ